MADLIDTTEMYLKTVFELEEEGIVPLRARIAERLHQSGPTVSQTVARMERDGLVTVEGDRHLRLTDEGSRRAMRVMRKHRLAERLLVDVIGLDWAQVHTEACRWEHVMSDEVEQRLLEILDHPTESPYGNPIPGLAELIEPATAPATHDYEAFLTGVERVDAVVSTAAAPSTDVVIVRIGEPIQTDEDLLATLHATGVVPGTTVAVTALDEQGRAGRTPTADGVVAVRIEAPVRTIVLPVDSAAHVFVRRA